MNRFLISILLGIGLLLANETNAQEREWEHSIYAGAGVFVVNEDHSVSKPFGLEAGYGLSLS